ncbi:MAG TPA: thioredoxin [Lachnospiraceae bacterium]|nr:thioredoxin [Lachnospiraceae bacterium]
MAEVILTAENFDNEVLNYEGKVLVDFWAVWCGPCQMLGPIVKDIADTVTDVKVGKVDCDAQSALAMKYGVSSIPTLVVFENGKEVNRSVGFIPKDRVLALLGK